MKFEIKLNLIKEYMRRLTISIQSVSSRVEFTGILITVFDNSISFEGRNDYMDIKIEETSLTDIKIIETGRILIKANLLNEIIQKMGGTSITFDKIDSNVVSVESEDSKYQMNLLSDEKYERAVFMGLSGDLITIPSKEFSNSISKVVFAGDELHTKFIYQGLNLIINNGEMSATVCDGIRIASYKQKIHSTENINKTIPLKVVKELSKILPLNTDYKFYFTEDRGIVVAGNMINQFELIEGVFPIFDKYFDSSIYTKQLTIKKNILDNAIGRATIIILNKADSSNRIALDINENLLTIETREIESGTAKVDITKHKYSGDSINISISPKILHDGLKTIESEWVKLFFTENRNSVLMVSETDGLVYLMSPMI